VQDFTSDATQIAASLHSLEAGDNGAAILDAVDYSVKLLNKAPEGEQKVLLLISETRDHGSHWAKLDDVIARVGGTNTAMYSLTFSPSLSQVLDTERGSNRDEVFWGAPPDLNGPILMARQALRKNTAKAIASRPEANTNFSSRANDSRLA